MMGVDARPGEVIDVGVRPDSLFVVYLDGSNGSCRVLSIPRDTRTTLPGYGQSKINHALAVGGVPYETLVVENLLGIELQHYGLIDFAGVEGLVDGVGGITVNNDYAFSAGGHDYPLGMLELDGDEALAYARYRGGPDGDFGRQERQQAVVRAILTQGADLNAVTAIPSLLDSVGDHVRTDMGPDGMVDIAQDFRSTCTGDTLETERIEGTVAWAYDDLMQMELSFVLMDQREIEQKVGWLLTGDETAPAAPPATPVAIPDATPAAVREGDAGG
jgi:LCP family protein required for cell wall assembly